MYNNGWIWLVLILKSVIIFLIWGLSQWCTTFHIHNFLHVAFPYKPSHPITTKIIAFLALNLNIFACMTFLTILNFPLVYYFFVTYITGSGILPQPNVTLRWYYNRLKNNTTTTLGIFWFCDFRATPEQLQCNLM